MCCHKKQHKLSNTKSANARPPHSRSLPNRALPRHPVGAQGLPGGRPRLGRILGGLKLLVHRALGVVDRMLPRGLPRLEVEVEELAVGGAQRPPRVLQRGLQAVPGDPQEVTVGIRVHAQALRVRVHVVVCGLGRRVHVRVHPRRVRDDDPATRPGTCPLHRGEAYQLHYAAAAQAGVRNRLAVRQHAATGEESLLRGRGALGVSDSLLQRTHGVLRPSGDHRHFGAAQCQHHREPQVRSTNRHGKRRCHGTRPAGGKGTGGWGEAPRALPETISSSKVA
mmetsp:Transcript_23436/g.70400  ORF Transcript_23436/g.70400 Transcript_23436/m.70400 type:complete len:280 (-) Transcript_23436:33-872(-)